ncbi:hypothetical protein F4859DRAFT_492694 [Xylaria cf. heliscus]|nr:hypothetical protein F4859DRAFT_492694 [Xylaria cf. heliscus]
MQMYQRFLASFGLVLLSFLLRTRRERTSYRCSMVFKPIPPLLPNFAFQKIRFAVLISSNRTKFFYSHSYI